MQSPFREKKSQTEFSKNTFEGGWAEPNASLVLSLSFFFQ